MTDKKEMPTDDYDSDEKLAICNMCSNGKSLQHARAVIDLKRVKESKEPKDKEKKVKAAEKVFDETKTTSEKRRMEGIAKGNKDKAAVLRAQANSLEGKQNKVSTPAPAAAPAPAPAPAPAE